MDNDNNALENMFKILVSMRGRNILEGKKMASSKHFDFDNFNGNQGQPQSSQSKFGKIVHLMKENLTLKLLGSIQIHEKRCQKHELRRGQRNSTRNWTKKGQIIF